MTVLNPDSKDIKLFFVLWLHNVNKQSRVIGWDSPTQHTTQTMEHIMSFDKYRELQQLLDLDTAIAYTKQQISELQYTLEEYPRSSATIRRIGQWEVALRALYDEAHTLLNLPQYAKYYDAETMPELPSLPPKEV